MYLYLLNINKLLLFNIFLNILATVSVTSALRAIRSVLTGAASQVRFFYKHSPLSPSSIFVSLSSALQNNILENNDWLPKLAICLTAACRIITIRSRSIGPEWIQWMLRGMEEVIRSGTVLPGLGLSTKNLSNKNRVDNRLQDRSSWECPDRLDNDNNGNASSVKWLARLTVIEEVPGLIPGHTLDIFLEV